MSAASGSLARQRRDELALTVARDAGDAEDLAGVHAELTSERDVPNGVRRRGTESRSTTRRGAPCARALRWCGCGRSPPIIIRASDAGVSARGIAFAGHPAAAQHGRAVAQRADLVELVADVEDAAAFGGERSQRGEEIRHRLRRQHRRWLVHDEERRLLQQRADDLDALPLRHRQRVHRARRVERQPVALRDFAHPRGHVGGVRAASCASEMFSATVSVSNSEKCWNTIAMPRLRARAGLAIDDGLAVPADGPGIGTHDAVDDLHQRRLAGAVLAQHRVDLARCDREVDSVVGDDVG